jgi:tripartite-type tricarboxylate transporter receptor subunit TctC
MKKLFAVVCCLLLTAGLFANGQQGGAAGGDKPLDWPKKTITISGAGAGGDTDIQARIVAKYLAKELGVDVVVVNISTSGAATELALRNAPNDGYTIFTAHNGNLIARLTGQIKYPPSEYFTIIGFPVFDPTNCVAAVSEAPYNNLLELRDYLLKNPNQQIFYGTNLASYTHVQIAAIKKALNLNIKLIDVGNASEKNAALLGRKVSMIGSQYGLIKDYFTNGDFKCLALLTDKKPADLSKVPTTVEQGLDIKMDKWFYYYMRKDVDPRILQKLNDALNAVVKDPGFNAEIAKYYEYSRAFTLDEAAKFWDEEYKYYSQYQDALNESL